MACVGKEEVGIEISGTPEATRLMFLIFIALFNLNQTEQAHQM